MNPLCWIWVVFLIQEPLSDWHRKAPSQLLTLHNKLEKAGGNVSINQVDRDRWELSVDFSRKITDDALESLHDVRDVVAIRILKGGVTDNGIQGLKNLPDLQVLVVHSMEVTDKGLKRIGSLKSLRKLDINSDKFTGIGLAALSELDSLSELYLYGSEAGEIDLSPLKRMKNLKTLYLPKGTTMESLAELKRALPMTEVAR